MKVILLLLIGWVVSTTVMGQNVFKTPSGTKYHTSTCHVVKNVSEEISLTQAAQLGLQPCKICQPQLYAAAQPIVHKAQGQDKGVRCKGNTKAGKRCKHYTKIANGYCFQHQPQ